MTSFFEQKKKITSVDQFVNLIAYIHGEMEKIYNSDAAIFDRDGKEILFYRGQELAKYGLSASIYRNDGYRKSESEIYKNVLHNFPKNFSDDVKLIDKLIRMQHCGIPTRLLDVTSNPLVALFFAVAGYDIEGEKQDGKVWFISCKQKAVVFSDDIADALTLGLERTINVDAYFCTALNVYLRFNIHLRGLLDSIQDSILKASFSEFSANIELIMDKNDNRGLHEFVDIWRIVNQVDSLICATLYFGISSKLASENDKEGRAIIDSLKKLFYDLSLDYIQRTSDDLGIALEPYKYDQSGDKLTHFFRSFWDFIIIKPKMNSERIKRQHGAFFYHSPVLYDYNYDKLADMKFTGMNASSIIVDANSKARIREELGRIGITHGYLFPELNEYRNNIKARYHLPNNKEL